MDRKELKQVILEQQALYTEAHEYIPREQLPLVETFLNMPHSVTVTGIRRGGKSVLLEQVLKTHYPDQIYYLLFEDERLMNFTANDFELMLEIFIELYGERKVFFLDEVQNVEGWELFVRRMQKRGYKFFITGSNATLLSKELGTHLTGRHVQIELLPFSFREFLDFHQFEKKENLTTQERGNLRKLFDQYLEFGGMPEYLQYKTPAVLQAVYDDIIYKDIAVRYEIKDVKALREIALYLLSNIAKPYSYNRLKNLFHLGSVTTVKNYVHYLENSYLLFSINRFSYSLASQSQANRKVYSIDNGFVRTMSFQFSKNIGRYLENLVFLELKRRDYEIFYYMTKNNLEVDFLLRKGTEIIGLIQVTHNMGHPDTKEREIKALRKAMAELNIMQATIITQDTEDTLHIPEGTIHCVPVHEWVFG